MITDGLPRPPEKPHPDECCHRHCEPCILDYWFEAMDRWRARIEARGLDPDAVLLAFQEG
ncbi:MAG: oxidoreductase-like domain-containing protein [Caulobacteraceae bacterium]